MDVEAAGGLLFGKGSQEGLGGLLDLRGGGPGVGPQGKAEKNRARVKTVMRMPVGLSYALVTDPKAGIVAKTVRPPAVNRCIGAGAKHLALRLPLNNQEAKRMPVATAGRGSHQWQG